MCLCVLLSVNLRCLEKKLAKKILVVLEII